MVDSDVDPDPAAHELDARQAQLQAEADALRGRWRLHIGDTRKLLPDLLGSLGKVDIFLHDSDHSYEAMSFEFEQAFPRLEHGGLLMSDDTHLHTAWDDFCVKHDLRPTRVGHLGVTRKRRNARTSSSARSEP